MAFSPSGASLRHLICELQDELVGSRLENLYQLDPATFLLRFRSPGKGRQQLLLPLGGLCHLTPASQSTPATPSLAAQVLRKHLRSGRLTGVGQPGLDRILWFDFTRGEVASRLVVEFFRQGNLLLVQGGLLVWVLKPRDYRHRSLRVGEAYQLPPQGLDPTREGPEALADRLLEASGPLVKFLARELNLGPRLAGEVVAQQGLEGEVQVESLGREAALGLASLIGELLDTGRTRPHLYLLEGRPVAAYPWPSKLHPDHEAEATATLQEAYGRLYRARREREREATPDPEADRHQRRLNQQERAIERYRQAAAQLNQAAETLYSHFQRVEQMLETLQRAVDQDGWEVLAHQAAELEGLVEVDPVKKLMVVALEGQQIPLLVEASVQANASRLFALAKRAASKAQGARVAQARAREQRASRQQRAQAAKGATAGDQRTFWFERFRWFVTSAGNVAVAGRDAASNELVVRRYLRKRDIYCHGDLTGAPSVVVKHRQGVVDPAAALEGCLYSLAYSKAWGARVASGHTFWAEADQVSKSPQTGEFLAKGAFVIRGQRHWHRNLPVQAAVGWVEVEGVAKVMGGPLPALEALSSRYLVLRPGYLDRRRAARLLAEALGTEASVLERVLPPGDCDLVRAQGVEVAWPQSE